MSEAEKTGKWIKYEEDSHGKTQIFMCSECKNKILYWKSDYACDYEYCPICRAKMITHKDEWEAVKKAILGDAQNDKPIYDDLRDLKVIER